MESQGNGLKSQRPQQVSTPTEANSAESNRKAKRPTELTTFWGMREEPFYFRKTNLFSSTATLEIKATWNTFF